MKKTAMLMLCLVLVFALAACAGTDTTPQGSVSDTVTVTDMKGEVAIPANPQRIVDVAGLTEELLILDMKVIASANTSMFDGVSVPKHLTTLFAEKGIEVVGNYSGSSSTGDLNLEKIAELKPDLIIMNIRHEKVYEQLAAIAPTVMIDDDIKASCSCVIPLASLLRLISRPISWKSNLRSSRSNRIDITKCNFTFQVLVFERFMFSYYYIFNFTIFR